MNTGSVRVTERHLADGVTPEAERAATDDRTIQQSLEIVRRRVDEVGTREPTIQRQGKDRILIQVPGIGSAEELKKLIGTTAKLTFNPVVGRGTDPNARPGPGHVLLPSMDEPGVFYTLEENPVVTGEDLTDARPSFDPNGQPAVDFRFGPQGARRFGAYTAANVGQPFAIVLDNQVISAPVIRDAITTGSGQISGSMGVDESNRLAVLLRAGALPAEMTFLEERTIGPELGQDSIDAGRLSSIIATAAVVAYMIASYGLFGVFASIAVTVNETGTHLYADGYECFSTTLPAFLAPMAFVVTDNAATTRVVYHGDLPDLFREGQGIVAQGAFGADRTFHASQVLAKHDENYMPREVIDTLKAQGVYEEPTS